MFPRAARDRAVYETPGEVRERRIPEWRHQIEVGERSSFEEFVHEVHEPEAHGQPMLPEGPASGDDLRPHIAFIFWGTFALGFGSTLLLPGPIVWLFGGGTNAFVLRIPAVVIHFVGWMFVQASLKAFPLDSVPSRRRLQDKLFAIWMFWLVAAIIGIGTLPLAFPELYCTIICLPEGWLLLPYFPFVPSVFAPVALGHAIFFRLESKMLGAIPTRTVTRAAQLLGGLAVTSIVIQAAGLFSGWAYLLAGLTAPGYFLAAIGYNRAWRDASSFTGISNDAAPRSAAL